MQKTVLSNGIRIVTQPMAHVRSVSMGVWVAVGARDETPAENGLSHLIEHLIFKGTQKRSAFQIAKEFDAIGGQTNAFTSMEYTCYHARVMDAHLYTMVDILSDIFLNSRFDHDDLLKERPVILQEIGMVEDSPDDYIHLLSGMNFWGDHPLGRSILGSRENILRFDAGAIKAFFQRLYQPDRIVISAAGNLDHQEFVDLVGPAFASIRPGDAFPRRNPPRFISRVNVHSRELEQTHICIGTRGLPTVSPRRYTLSLMNTILGGNMSSRLFQEVRENRGLAYAVYSFVSSHMDTGMFGAYAAVDPANAYQTALLFLEQFKKLKNFGTDESELTAAKEFIKGNLLLAAESSENQMVRLAQNEIHFNRHVPLGEVLRLIEAVSPDDLLALAGDLFSGDTLSITLLGAAAAGNKDYENLQTVL